MLRTCRLNTFWSISLHNMQFNMTDGMIICSIVYRLYLWVWDCFIVSQSCAHCIPTWPSVQSKTGHIKLNVHWTLGNYTYKRHLKPEPSVRTKKWMRKSLKPNLQKNKTKKPESHLGRSIVEKEPAPSTIYASKSCWDQANNA